MSKAGHYTHSEILSQPDVWAGALTALDRQTDELCDFFRRGGYETILFTGCGSTYYLALAAAAITQKLVRIPARGVPASEIWLHPDTIYSPDQRTLLVAISRSGETTETLRACEAFQARASGDLVTLSCYPDQPLATMGALNLVFPGAQEQSIAQTRAFSTLYLATVALATLWGDHREEFDQLGRLPETGRHLLATYAGLPAQLVTDQHIDRFYFLGSGVRYGLACELNLKMKEISLSHSEPFHFMEFRHGPMSMVTESTLLVGLISDTQQDQERAVLADMRARGARLLTMAEHEADVVFASGVDESLRNVLYLPIGQLIAFERALFKSLDPDHPHNLTAVVKLT